MARTLVALLVLLSLGAALGGRDNFRRQTDSNSALEAKVSELEDRLATLEARATKKAAIRTALTGMTFQAQQPVPFQVVEEIGGGFDNSTSRYTAPFSGWYTIDVQIFPIQTGTLYVDLVAGGHAARAVCRNDLDTDRIVSSTCHVGLSMHVEAGVELWLSLDSPGPFWSGQWDSFFTAVLVIPDD